MKERPILFQVAMVRALLAGTKTQTRRVAKCAVLDDGTDYRDEDGWPLTYDEGTDSDMRAGCPYGLPGDQLWVREAFIHEPADYCWEASVSIPSRPASTVYRADFPQSRPGEGWKPSIHMPRKLSRITLEITGVRVERLQAISEADAWAEGIGECLNDSAAGVRTTSNEPMPVARALYRDLWEQINGAGSWDANPWVWVVEFKRL